jgi:uncharacterized membrane protein
MDRRPISDQIRWWLTGELDVWQAGGILTDDQPARILDLYETASDAVGHRRSRAVFAISSLAVLMIGLAVFLAVGYNWQAMSAAGKLVVIFGAVVGMHASGFASRFRSHWRLGSEIIFFLACILYGVGISLIAQIFHIQSHYPDGIWFWALGVLPFALCMDTVLLHALYAGLLAIWVGTETLGFPGTHLWLFHGISVPRAAWTLPLMALPGLQWAYRKESALAVAIYAALLAWWAILQPVAWQWDIDPIYFVGLAGALFLLIAEMHSEESSMARPYRLFGVLLTGGVLVPLSFGDYVFRLARHGSAGDNFVAGLVVGLVGAVAALAVVVLQQRDTSAGSHGRQPFSGILTRQWLPLAMLSLLAGLCFWSGLFRQYDPQHPWYGYYGHSDLLRWTPQVLVPAAAVNAMMIVLALWLMRVGVREDRTGPFAVGVLYFLLWAILRYVDLFAGVGGMLGAAVMFLLCGVGLLVVARFWLHRKETHHD